MLIAITLIINAILFTLQMSRTLKRETTKTLTLLSFFTFFLIQSMIVLQGILHKETWPIFSYFLSTVFYPLVAFVYYKFILSNNEISLDEIIEQLPGHVYWKDKNGLCLGCNTNNWKDFGLKSLADFKNKKDHQIFSKSDADHLRAIDKEVMDTGKQIVAEETITSANGSKPTYLSYKVPLKNKKNQIQGVLGFSIDITNTKKEITDKLEMLENIIAVMPGNVYWMNREGVYLGCNDNEAASVGLKSRKDIVGKKNIDIPGFVIPEVLDPVNEKVMTKGETMTIEEPAVLQDGTQATFLSKKVPLRNSENEIIGMVGISFDITERKKNETLLKEAKERTEQINKNVIQAAHDIRSPLAALSIFVQTLSSLAEPERVMMRRAINRINDIAHDLLEKNRMIINSNHANLIKEEAVSKELLFTLVNTLVIEKRLEFKHRTNITMDFNVENAGYSCFALVNSSVFKRILSNLINNSIDAINDEGKVILTLSANETWITLKLHDTGKGMSPEVLAKLGEKGFSHEKITGNGLGIYHAKEQIQSWNGSFYAESYLGKGTTITLQFPTTNSPPWFTKQLSINQKETIIVLDDDPSIHQIWIARFEPMRTQYSLDIAFKHFFNTTEFWDWFNNNSIDHECTLYLFDHEFAGCKESGFDILRSISCRKRILVTSYFEDSTLRTKCEKHGIKLMSKDMAGFVPIITT